jgi:hypothetical protein
MSPRGRLFSFMIGDELRGQLRAVASSYRQPEAELIRNILSAWLQLSADEKQRFLRGVKGGESAMKRSQAVEDTTGRGYLRFEDGSKGWATRYRLTVDVEQVRAGDQWLDGLQEIEALATDLAEDVQWTLMGGTDPLILELEDGRHFACFYAGEGRLVARTGHALFRPEKTY